MNDNDVTNKNHHLLKLNKIVIIRIYSNYIYLLFLLSFKLKYFKIIVQKYNTLLQILSQKILIFSLL